MSEKNIAACLQLAQGHGDKPEVYWKIVLLTDETLVELLGLNEKHYVWQRPNTAFLHKNLIQSVKRDGGSIIVWACFAAFRPDVLPSLMEP